MDITDEFDSSGNPINWKNIRSFGHRRFGSGTLNWDTALPNFGQWALRMRGDGTQIIWVEAGLTGLEAAGYRAGNRYMNSEGEVINTADPGNSPSGMSVTYFVFDKG